MATSTPTIKYNLKDRGRKHTGQARNFNIRAVCDAINSPATQEAVELRTMYGYYGHGPRIRFGLDAVEGGIHNGKYVPVEPAFITTHLKADYDGNVEHRAEFLDTESGKIAEKLWNGKVGGFSSAIDTSKPAFFGFDLVLSPNYISNSFRGVSLDSADSKPQITYDDALEMEQEERLQAQAITVLLDNVQVERKQTAAVIERLQIENEELLSMLARTGKKAVDVLDAVSLMPIAVAFDQSQRMERDTKHFMGLKKLPETEEPVDEPTQDNSAGVGTIEGRMMNRFIR